MNTVPKVRRFRKSWLLAGLSVLVIIVGVLVWSSRSSGKKVVAIPGSVCQQALPSSDIKALLPKEGEEFKEVPITTGFALPAEPSVHGGGGSCDLSGGGQAIGIQYNLLLDGYPDEKIQKDAARAGLRALSLGEAKGYVGQVKRHPKDLTTASLYMDCPKPEVRDSKYVLNVAVTRTGNRADATTRQHVVSLISEATRVVAREILGCKDAGRLPNGPAKVER
ncbi:hypothetical protein OG698_28335 [Streptomyces sp. NBC_01003]|uniref:hypothetical protein n=1 Tax=Streptomyces sp. NBC_01003 TaxID=2903714 RepID=UPI003863BD6C|nr:hypothetical protein OG698_28335 [Streptomyces sp. NBC_01003]